MAVWTISAQVGTGGERIAAELAASAGVPLLDREALARLAREREATLARGLDPRDVDTIEERFCGRLSLLGLGMATMTGSAAAYAVPELQLRQHLPELARTIAHEAAREPCVIYAPGAFAALADATSAVHVRLWAPLECRISAYQREHLIDRHEAEKAVKHHDHAKQEFVRWAYRLDLDDDRNFSLVLDTSRFSVERAVDLLLAAAGVTSRLSPSPA